MLVIEGCLGVDSHLIRIQCLLTRSGLHSSWRCGKLQLWRLAVLVGGRGGAGNMNINQSSTRPGGRLHVGRGASIIEDAPNLFSIPFTYEP